jgi:CheY-like chemotaxis protein
MEKVLVVEDISSNYILIEEILSEYALDLYWAKDGKEFYKMIHKTSTYDLVLMDLMLPDTDGIELTKYLIQKDIRIPVVFISAYTERCEEIFELGVEYFINKPIYKDLFLSILGKFVSLEKKGVLD